MATLEESDNSIVEMIERLDKALYTAKASGRNTVKRWRDANNVSLDDIRQKIKDNSSEESDIVSMLSTLYSLKDQVTSWHSNEMSDLVVEIGKKYNLDRNQIEEVRVAALLHDIGKIGIPDSILKKDGPLTDDEWKMMKHHPRFGRDILKKLKNLKKISQAIYYHHERWDGKGYPEGLKGEQIPLAARMISIIDALEAMICDRPYRKSLSIHEAIKELKKNAGTQFDPNLIKVFLENKEYLVEKYSKYNPT